MQVAIHDQFGKNDHPLCARCGSLMYVSRRSPAPDPAQELQVLSCRECANTAARTADMRGEMSVVPVVR